jgi:hypothetical protein
VGDGVHLLHDGGGDVGCRSSRAVVRRLPGHEGIAPNPSLQRSNGGSGAPLARPRCRVLRFTGGLVCKFLVFISAFL